MAGIDEYAKVMLHGDGADGSTTITDSSLAPKTVTAYGDAQIDTAQSKFGGSSFLFDGTGDYLVAADSADYDFGTGEFTMEGWVRVGSIPSVSRFLSAGSRADTAYNAWFLGFGTVFGGGTKLNFGVWTGNPVGNIFESSSALTANIDTWYHWAAVRSGANIYFFWGGVLVGTWAIGASIEINSGSTTGLVVGCKCDANATDRIEFLNGWLDEIRVSKGIARWTSDFTPPTSAYSFDCDVVEVETSEDSVDCSISFSASVTESSTSADTSICSKSADIGDTTETFAGSDVVGGYLNTQTMDLTEASESADVVEATAGVEADVTEGVAGSDVVVGYQGEIVSVTETVAGADTLDIDMQSGYQETISDSIFMWETIKTGWNVSTSETLTVVDAASSPIMAKIAEWLALNETIIAAWAGVESIDERLTLLDAAKAGFLVTISDEMAIADTATIKLMMAILEHLGFTELITGVCTFQKTLDESITLSDEARGAYAALISDVLDAVDAVSVVTTFLDTLDESLVTSDTVTDIVRVLMDVSDPLVLVDTTVANVVFYNVIYETLKMSLTVELDGEAYECWVLNTGKFYPSLYSGFDFNSYATFEGRHYGANATGIFELTGTTDNGAVIHAGLELPETNFGVPNQKRFRKGYVGISGTRPLMQVETEDGATKTYEIDTEGEIDMTRDMRSKAWKLRLTDFESLDFIKLFPVVLAK